MIVLKPILQLKKRGCARCCARSNASSSRFRAASIRPLVLKIATAELGENALGVTGRSESLAEFANWKARRIRAGDRRASRRARYRGSRGSELRGESRRTAVISVRKNSTGSCQRSRGSAARVHRRRLQLDDEADCRPGRKAAREYGVRSPLAEAGFANQTCAPRAQARTRSLGQAGTGLSLVALSVRHGDDGRLLRAIERAERAVCDAGFSTCRVRHYGELARIESPLDELPRDRRRRRPPSRARRRARAPAIATRRRPRRLCDRQPERMMPDGSERTTRCGRSSSSIAARCWRCPPLALVAFGSRRAAPPRRAAGCRRVPGEVLRCWAVGYSRASTTRGDRSPRRTSLRPVHMRTCATRSTSATF